MIWSLSRSGMWNLTEIWIEHRFRVSYSKSARNLLTTMDESAKRVWNSPLNLVKQKLFWRPPHHCGKWLAKCGDAQKFPSPLCRKFSRLRAQRFTWYVDLCLTEKRQWKLIRWLVNNSTKVYRKLETMNFLHSLNFARQWFHIVRDGEMLWVVLEDGALQGPHAKIKTFIQKIIDDLAVGRPNEIPKTDCFHEFLEV